MALISIIVPVYNTPAEYLRRCIDSIKKQTFQDLEVIIIDDGSEQWCSELLDTICSSLRNVRVIHKPNEGVSASRNLGIELSESEYVTFVDSDDILTDFAMEDAAQAIRKYHPEIVYGLVRFTSDKDICMDQSTSFQPLQKVLSKTERKRLYYHLIDLGGKEFFNGGDYISRGPFARVVSRAVAQKCNFPIDMKIGEDIVWNLNLLRQVENVVVSNSLWYIYVQQPESAMHQFKADLLAQHEKRLSEMWKLADDEEARYRYLNFTMKTLYQFSRQYYFAKDYPNGTLREFMQFREMVHRFPWNASMKRPYVGRLSAKQYVKYLLISNGILFLWWKWKYSHY